MVITLSQISKKLHDRLIKKMREDVKKQDPYIKKCKEYGKDLDFVDSIKIMFEPLDVSAKTINSVVVLNEELLKSDKWEDIMRYIVHELTHCFQQQAGEVDGKVDKDKYLDDENEQQAFQAQIEYMDDHEPPEEIQRYLEQLLDHHNIKGPKRKHYIKELTKDI